jgi:pimeloyl-ACP methyl ester carboxylesterase
MSPTTYNDIALASGIKFHYASAGSPRSPVVLLLHGYPTSSFQYRDLIPILARSYRVIAPDLPGFGHTTYPPSFRLTFASIATAIGDFVDALQITRTAVYVFDYGAPTAFRLALDRPELVVALITQNGNAFEEGLGPFWDPLKAWWQTGNKKDAARSTFHAVLGDIESTRAQYVDGVPQDRLNRIDPKTYTFDYLHNLLPEDKRQVQLDLFWDYQTNIELYPRFQAWIRDSRVPILAIWGKNDTIFVPAGAEAFQKSRGRDGAEEVKVVLLDGGHFLLETHLEEVADHMLEFLGKIEL